MADAAGSSKAKAGLGLGERLRAAALQAVKEAGAAFQRTPLEVLLGFAAALGLSVAVERQTMDTWVRLLVAVGLALPLTYAASALYVRGIVPAAVRWGISGAAVVFGALWGFLGPDNPPEAEVWRTWLLVLTGVAALLCVPLVGAGGDERRARVHAFVARLVGRTAIVLAYAAALWIGLALALAAVNGLFELRLPGKAWVHLTAALFALLPPWAIAAGLPALVAPPASWRPAPLLVLRRVGLFLLSPLILVYLGIVYAYTVRVLGTGEVPKNLVSPVVIGAGLLVVASTVALEPTHEDERASGLRLLVRLAAPLLLPLVLFAMWAVTTRVDQYGWTEFRYLRLLLLALLATYAAAALYRLWRRRRPPLTWVPAVLGVVLLLSAAGPWSAPAVARRSQAAGLRALLAQAHVTGATVAPGPSRAAVAPVAVPTPLFRGIVSKTLYLRDHFGWSAVAAAVPWIGAPLPGRRGGDLLARRLGIVEKLGPGGARIVNAHLNEQSGFPGVIGGTLWVFEARAPQPPSTRGRRGPAVPARRPPLVSDRPAVEVGAPPARFRVTVPGGDTLVAQLVPLLNALLARSAGRPEQPNRFGPGVTVDVQLVPGEAVQPLLAAGGRVAGQVLFRHITFESTPAALSRAAPADAVENVLRVYYAQGFILLPAAPESAATPR